MIPPLTRARDGRPSAPVRILHLGLGGFFRAHQAWYTENAPDAPEWGIAAFTGRSTRTADRLNAQDGMYTLVARGPDGDRFERVGAVSAAHPGGDHAAWLRYWREPRLAVVTLTVTEAGYTRTPGGALDTALPDVRADIAALRAAPHAPVGTVAARLLAGLAARRRAGGGPVAVVPCDNLPGNGRTAARIVRELAEAVGPAWARAAAHASYVDTVADRITPWPTGETAAAVAAATGRTDAAPVVAEPFAEWALCGEFPAGRPRWEAAGARFVPDIAPYERRKLRLLNGGHSLLAYAGSLRGHTTVAEAMTDPLCRTWLTEWWDEASAGLGAGPGPAAYRAALVERFANPRIAHALAKIAENGADKLLDRVVPAVRAARGSGRIPAAAVRIIAAYLLYERGGTARSVSGPPRDAACGILHRLDPALALDPGLVDAVALQAHELARR
ncbi:mannitol dehydrogenase family protein [Actinomadura rifamycini]|uniref:mannitol dehydrogenase family protein n=1 Tax=Actinomadura rifamycini TaxID=31962 RepID=UPI0004199C00|nr:mannitol dehydrogenase family protein [Actinomadura rifamycini]